jgi:hypothetical protein
MQPIKRYILLQKRIILVVTHGGECRYFGLLGCDAKISSRQTRTCQRIVMPVLQFSSTLKMEAEVLLKLLCSYL